MHLEMGYLSHASVGKDDLTASIRSITALCSLHRSVVRNRSAIRLTYLISPTGLVYPTIDWLEVIIGEFTFANLCISRRSQCFHSFHSIALPSLPSGVFQGRRYYLTTLSRNGIVSYICFVSQLLLT